MADELTDILSSDENEITEEQLIKYVSGELSGEEKHLVEKAILNSALIQDAVEGLQQSGDKEKLEQIKRHLGSDIRRIIGRRKEKSKRRKIRELNWVIIFIVIVLLLVFIAFVLVRSGIEL